MKLGDRLGAGKAIARFSLSLNSFSDLCLLGWARDRVISLSFDLHYLVF
jgi:hypothetical protein